MTDPVRLAPSPAPQVTGTPTLPDLLSAGEWRRALAVSRVGGLHPDLQAALQNVVDVQESVRARRYAVAQRALESYRAALAALRAEEPETAALLQSHADPDALRAGVDALDRLQREPDPATLEAGLAPALGQPLTRAEALNLRGVQRALQGDAGAAHDLFTEALAADPGHYRALSNLGNMALEAGDNGAAEARYREAIALNPEYDGGHHNLGVALRRQGKVWDGVQAIKQGQKLNVKQAKADAKAEAQEQLRRDPRLRALRWLILTAVVALAAWALLNGGP